MQASVEQPHRAPDGAPVNYERHRPEQTELYRLVHQYAAIFIAQTEAATGDDLPQFVKDEFDAFLECGILAHGFLSLRCGDFGHDKLVAFSCKRRGLCPSCGSRRMAPMAAHLLDHVTLSPPLRYERVRLSDLSSDFDAVLPRGAAEGRGRAQRHPVGAGASLTRHCVCA